jgi:hypothetical protein
VAGYRALDEVRIETNSHNIALVFSDLQVTELPPGYAPFVLRDDAGPPWPTGSS